jgi:hypothetical protein
MTWGEASLALTLLNERLSATRLTLEVSDLDLLIHLRVVRLILTRVDCLITSVLGFADKLTLGC